MWREAFAIAVPVVCELAALAAFLFVWLLVWSALPV